MIKAEKAIIFLKALIYPSQIEKGGEISAYLVDTETISLHIVSMETTHKNSDIASVIIGKLMSISGILKRESNRLLEPFGLNHQQFSILFEIAKAGRIRQKDTTNRLSLEKAHVSKVVSKLNSMGLISINSSEEDKRSAYLSVTEKGEQTVKRCRKVINSWKTNKLGHLNEADLSAVLDSISLLQNAFLNQ